MLQSINNMNFMNKNSSKKGFTLIELLVVIAIIGVLNLKKIRVNIKMELLQQERRMFLLWQDS